MSRQAGTNTRLDHAPLTFFFVCFRQSSPRDQVETVELNPLEDDPLLLGVSSTAPSHGDGGVHDEVAEIRARRAEKAREEKKKGRKRRRRKASVAGIIQRATKRVKRESRERRRGGGSGGGKRGGGKKRGKRR